jgi:uncharacterized protein
MHKNEVLIRDHLAKLSTGDVHGALDDYTEDAVLHYPGRNALSGTHRGRGEIATFLGQAMSLTSGTFRPEVHDALANDDHAIVLVACRAERDGTTFEWLATDVYHTDGNRISEHWIFENDQHSVDQLFHV